MTTVRIVFAHQSIRPARAPDGSDVPDWRLHQRLVVLADTVLTKENAESSAGLKVPRSELAELVAVRAGITVGSFEVPRQ